MEDIDAAFTSPTVNREAGGKPTNIPGSSTEPAPSHGYVDFVGKIKYFTHPITVLLLVDCSMLLTGLELKKVAY